MKFLFVVVPFFVVSFVMYLMGSFLSASWNPSEWTRADRAFCLITAMGVWRNVDDRLAHGRKHGDY